MNGGKGGGLLCAARDSCVHSPQCNNPVVKVRGKGGEGRVPRDGFLHLVLRRGTHYSLYIYMYMY